ncbi:MAG: DUF4082 domain-containing protein [Isosphaeraceae bacterium]
MRFSNLRHPARSHAAKLRRLRPEIDRLESRELLSTTAMTANPMFELGPLATSATPPSGAYTPAQIRQAYQFNQISFDGVAGTGAGETIAIVDAYDDPNIQADLNSFDTQFGLPGTTVTRVSETGTTRLPTTDPTGGWELEESLDVEWAHAMAPGATILLVEASSASDSDLLAAVGYAAAHTNVVSMSWGGGEFAGETADDGDFSKARVAFVASSGDDGAPASWPAASPNVLAVGGTALTLGAGNVWSSEVGWSGSGGGPSAYEPQPAYQAGVVTQTSTKRANPDVAYDASPSTGYAVYDSNKYEGTTYDWLTVGGTSAGAPQWSALLAIADQGRALGGQPAIDSASPQEVMTTLYKNPGDFHDITAGTSTGSPHYSAGPGYDYVTGLGTPIANAVVDSLDGISAYTNDTLVLNAKTAETAGSSFSLTVTANGAGGVTDAGYLGTIAFTSSDVQAGLPANYTFTAADDGSHTFTVTLKTAGSQSITATDTATSIVTGTLSAIRVNPAAASQFILSGLSSSAMAGVSETGTITVEDAYGNTATGYTGTIQFTSSDPHAILPAGYTFQAGDQGVHPFSVTFETAGPQSLTVKDNTSGMTATDSGIAVALPAPTGLTATAASTSQIDLTWIGSAGANGYQVQRSPNGTSGWTTIASPTAGTTGYQDSSLSAGTTYFYRVCATSSNLDSAYSNPVSATTASSTTSSVDTLWSNSYVPAENASSVGTYELGVKFMASLPGTVTGVRFYKQTWMNGYTQAGHLWSSTGTLLAAATFTHESASGWQQLSFSSPVTIQPDTVYIVSFSTGGGPFGISTNFFTRGGVANGPLTALANGVDGGDGVYQTRDGAFPELSGAGMNFWVDVAFAPSSSTSARAGSPSVSSPGMAVGPAGIALTIGANPFAVAPSGPSSSDNGSTGSSVSEGPQAAVNLVPWSYRRDVPQSRTPSWWRPGRDWSPASVDV